MHANSVNGGQMDGNPRLLVGDLIAKIKKAMEGNLKDSKYESGKRLKIVLPNFWERHQSYYLDAISGNPDKRLLFSSPDDNNILPPICITWNLEKSSDFGKLVKLLYF